LSDGCRVVKRKRVESILQFFFLFHQVSSIGVQNILQ
jgi:hypothetical protein